MRWGPARGVAIGGISFGVIVLVVGALLLLVNQGIIDIVFDFWTFCAISLIVIGGAAIVGSLWVRKWIHRGWRDWVHDDDQRRGGEM